MKAESGEAVATSSEKSGMNTGLVKTFLGQRQPAPNEGSGPALGSMMVMANYFLQLNKIQTRAHPCDKPSQVSVSGSNATLFCA